MAALQPTVGGLPTHDLAQKSFAAAVLSSPFHAPQSDPHANPSLHDPTVEHGTHGTHRGLPSIAFTDTSLNDLSKPFSWALIGKFTKGYNKQDPKLGRPSVEDLQHYFVTMDFTGSFQIGLLDNRHLLIQFQLETDYLRLYSRMVWYIRGISMRIFKWTPFFRVDKESSIVPIWITFPRLPIQFFHKSALFPIARLLGQPLRMDDATSKLKRPSVARVQIEIDVLLDRPDKIWIQMGSKEGYWQPVEYENIPPYCRHCWHLGHEEALCHVQHPDLKPPKNKKQPSFQERPDPPKQRWQPIVPLPIAASVVPPPLADSVVPPPCDDFVATPPCVDSVANPSLAVSVDVLPRVGSAATPHIEASVAVPSLDDLVAVPPLVTPASPIVDQHPPATHSIVVHVDEPSTVAPSQQQDEPSTRATPAPLAHAVGFSPVALIEVPPDPSKTLEHQLPPIIVPELIVPPMNENIAGIYSDDDVSQYPFLLPEMITDDTALYRRKLQEVVAEARSDHTKVLIEKPRVEILAEFREFSARMRSAAVEDIAQKPMSQDTIPLDDPEATLTEINVEDGDFADGFITVKPKNRGRGRPRKHKK